MTKCTWGDCLAQGINPQFSKDGEEWACLCDEHHEKLEGVLESARRVGSDAVLPTWANILDVWAKAQGGAAEAARRI